MKNGNTIYVVSELPKNRKPPGVKERMYYCHMRQFPGVPIVGSVGTKQHARHYAELYNKTPQKKRARA